jgi:hypothetical protein
MGTRTSVISRIQGSHEYVTTALYVTDCANCGIVFAIPETLERRRREDGASWYCPNGHTMVFRETELHKAKERAELLERRLTFAQDQRRAAEAEALHERRRAAAARGQLTKMRNRVARGLCPQQSCRRSFTNLHDHVRHEHPELLDAIGDDT